MFFKPSAALRASLVVAAVVAAGAAQAADPSPDQAFVDKVSQGGRYEVEASTLAERRATAADVKDLANTEVHDHELVNARLKRVAESSGIKIAPGLNATFQQRLATLRAATAPDFDKAYIDDMKDIHDKDEKLFAKEATEGTSGFKLFAHQTDLIVKRHIGALHGND